MAAYLEGFEEQPSEGFDGPKKVVEGKGANVFAQVVRQVPPPVLHRGHDLLQMLTHLQALLEEKENSHDASETRRRRGGGA